MNEQTINAFNTFHSALSNAIDTLHRDLQSTNSLTSTPMYADQFNEIVEFQVKTKAFTQFLKEQSDFHRFQYSQFKASQKQQKVSQRSAVSSQISIQSTPISLNDWSYNANDGGSATDLQIWRGYDPQPAYNMNDDFGLFNDADIELFKNDPFKVIDTDNDSECTENIVPSLPPSVSVVPSISNLIDDDDEYDDDTKEIEHESAASAELYLYEEDIADGGEEDDEKWDIPLIKTIAFAGYFETAPIDKVEFKNDNVVKPKPPKWQEREEQNKQIIDLLNLNDINDIGDDIAIVEAAVERESSPAMNGEEDLEDTKEEEANAYANDIESKRSEAPITCCYGIQNNKCNDDVAAMLGMKSRQSMNFNMLNVKEKDAEDGGPGLLSTDIKFNTAGAAPPPIAFIQYERPKRSIYHKIEDHPHYHPLIHSEEGKVEHADDEQVECKETAMNDGENEAHHRSRRWNNHNNDGATSHMLTAQNNHEIQVIHNHDRRFIDRDIHRVSDSINGLRDALDHHFERNHNDFSHIKQALYSLREHRNRCNYIKNNHNNTQKKKRNQHQEHWRTKKKEEWNRK